MWMTLTPSLLRELPPRLRASSGRPASTPVSRGDVEQRLLDEVRDEPRIGAVRQHRGRARQLGVPQRERLFAQRVVRTLRRRQGRVGVAAGPRLDAGVEIERALLVAELDQRDARHVDRQVEQEIAAPDQRVEHAPVVLAGQRLLDEADAVLGRDLRAGSSAASTVMRSVVMSMWRRISGSTPWPMLPKPTKISRPGKLMCTG